jgi:L-rhamnose-H+ transport protein
MNPFLGVLFFAVAGFAAASFYVPINKVKGWAWETYWLTMGFVAWIIAPLIGAYLTTPDLWQILSNSPLRNILLTYFFGVLWGIGSLTCGLSFRYIGLSLGQSLALGFCAVFGTLIPPLFTGDINSLLSTTSGLIEIAGIAVCIGGISICGYAGVLKERKLTTEQKKEAIKDFALVKGFIVAICGGLMSAFMAFAFRLENQLLRQHSKQEHQKSIRIIRC